MPREGDGALGFWSRAVAWAKRVVRRGDKVRVIKRYPLPVTGRGSCDDISVRLDDLVLSVRRHTDLDLPFEVTVVVPRAEITKRYQDGKLVEEVLAYSSITIAHSPRPMPAGRVRSA